MKLRIEIDLGNAAFDVVPENEVCRLLHEASVRVSEYGIQKAAGRLLDINGNTCGKVEIISATKRATR